MFGGPIDLTPFGGWVKGIGVLYWVLAAAGLWWALHGDRPRGDKVLRAIPVLLVFGFWPVKALWTGIAANQRLTLAQAHFDMRCKSAGEKIHRTVKDVDGVALLRLRSKQINDGDQFRLDDPYGRDCGGESCISSLLFGYRTVPVVGGVAASFKRIYSFVEVNDPADGRMYRYEQSSPRAPLVKTLVVAPGARYGVIWDDVSTKEDRAHWVAGGSLKVVELQTNQVIAERTGYLLDRGQGSTAGARSPWTWARTHGPACPPVVEHNLTFVTKVLQPQERTE